MSGIIKAIILGAAVGGVSLLFFSMQHSMLIGLVALLVTLWTNEALPLGVVSLLPIILFPVFGISDVNAVASNYSNAIIFLFLGGFMLAIALEKTGLHTYFSGKLLNIFPKTPRGIIYALAVTSALLSSILSNTTITLMLMPIALYLSENVRLKTRFLLAVAYGSSLGGILTPIGTPPNLILIGFLGKHGLEAPAFGEWMALMFPVVGIMLLIVPWLLALKVTEESVADTTHSSISPLTSEQKRLYGIMAVLASTLLLNTFSAEFIGFALDEKLILLGFGLLMFVPKIGFLEWEDTRKFPYEIILLFGAGFSIASAFSSTGLAAQLAQKLSFISTLPFFWMLFIVAFVVTFATEVTSNTALTSIAIPIFYEFAKGMPYEEGLMLLMVATVAASYAFMLPIATPPNAIVMSSGVIHVKQMATVGFAINLIGICVLSVTAYMVWGWIL